MIAYHVMCHTFTTVTLTRPTFLAQDDHTIPVRTWRNALTFHCLRVVP